MSLPEWRHICIRNKADQTYTITKELPTVSIVLPRHLLVQGCEDQQWDVLIANKFQGAYNCTPVLQEGKTPKFGELHFLGNGWQYVATAFKQDGTLDFLKDEFSFQMYCPDLDLYSFESTVVIYAQ